MGDVRIEQKYDFNHDVQTFKVYVFELDLADGSRLLKVDKDFIDDNSIGDILSRFDQWKLGETLMRQKQLGILASRNGLETFVRGPL